MPKHIIAALTSAHRNMEQVLTLLRFQLDMLSVPADRDALTFLNNAVFYMHNFPGLTHHPVEEIIFKHLKQRTPVNAVLCEQLAGQHRVFQEQESLLLEDIRAARNGEDAAYRRTKELGVNYCSTHSQHIGMEESGALPLAIRYLADQDWQEVDAHSEALLERMTMRDELHRYDTLYDYLMMGTNLNLH